MSFTAERLESVWRTIAILGHLTPAHVALECTGVACGTYRIRVPLELPSAALAKGFALREFNEFGQR